MMTLTILNTCNRNESRPIEQNKLQLDTNSKCFSLECKMTLNETICVCVFKVYPMSSSVATGSAIVPPAGWGMGNELRRKLMFLEGV